ncbi:hypothetical protein GCM10023311_21130 [Flaviramulus aquimarinus]|uniref:Uncharacterized protein n=1 Tax=Flaviramulus aquimarinus TaxID=1170456 RepID=A0ABP9F7H8_9FLAO
MNLKRLNSQLLFIGGAGNIRKDNLSAVKEAEYRQKLEEAIRIGYGILKKWRKFRCCQKKQPWSLIPKEYLEFL